MAANNTTFTLKLKTEGMDLAQKQTQQIRDNLVAAQAAANKMGAAMGRTGGGTAPPIVASQAAGGSAGSRRAASSPAAQPTGSGGIIASQAAAPSSYGTARAVIGRGAGARDFASESRGLSGLVQIYATLAANLYAASAAFNALSEAANVANLVKGLDQLSASSGQNLTQVAKDLVKVTDGSISLQEALKVVAKASSAGISSENIGRLGSVAQKAAQALGIDAADAVDRLSRGITKLEPELLDELGLFTKIGPATEAYARKIGKSSLALTDFEKRQAFANAVLTEGEQKFNAIATQANPFTKLTAQLKDLSTSALTILNKFFIPLAEFLSSNPTALVAAIALIGKSLLGIAIPAVTSWKTSMMAASEAAKEAAQRLVEARRNQRAWKESLIGTQVADKSALANEKAKLAVTELQNKALEKNSKISQGTQQAIAGFDPKAPLETAAQQQAYQAKIDELEKRRQVAEKSAATPGKSAAYVAEKKAEAESIKQVNTALRERAVTEAEFNKVLSQAPPARYTQAAADERAARAQLLDAQKKGIVSNALEQQSLSGTRAGFSALYDSIMKARAGQDAAGIAYTDGTRKLGTMGTVAVATSGSLKLLGAGLSAVASALNRVMIGVAIFTAAFQAVDAFLGRSAKQEEAFKSATDALTGSIKVAGDALYDISTKKFLEPKSVQAVANAFNGLSDNLKKQIDTFTDLRNAQGSWDRWWDDRWDNIGRGSKSKLAENITSTILSAISLADDNSSAEIQKQFESVLGIKFTGREDLLKYIKKLANEDQKKLLELIPTFQKIGLAIGNSAGSLTQLDAGLSEVSKQINDINNSIKLTDAQGKLGTLLIAEAERMATAFEDPKNSLIILQKIVDDFNLISLFPPEEADKLAKAKSQIDELSKSYKEAESAKKAAISKVQEAPEGSQAKAVASVELQRATEQLDKVKTATEQATKGFKGVITSGIIDQAFKKVEISLRNALQEASIISAKSYLSVLSSVGGKTAKAETELEVRQLESQRDLIKANYDHANEIIKLRLVAEQQLQLDRIKKAETEKTNAESTATRENRVIEEAKAFIAPTRSVGAQKLEFAQQVLGKSNLAEATSKDSKFQEKFDKYFAEQTIAARGTLQTAASITERADKEIATASKALTDASTAQKRFYVEGKLDQKAIADAAKETGTFSSTIAKDLLIQAKGLQASLSKLDTQIKAVKFEGEAKVIREKAKAEGRNLQQQAEPLKEQETLINKQQEALGFYNQELQVQKEIVQEAVLKNEQAQKLAILQGEITIAEEVAAKEAANNSKKKIKDTAAADALASLQIDKSNILNKNTAELAALSQKYVKERLAGEQSLEQYRREVEAKKFANAQDLKRAQLDIQDQELKYYQSIGVLSDKDAILDAAAIERAKLALDIAKQQKDTAAAEIAIKEASAKPRSALQEIGKEIGAQPASFERTAALEANDALIAGINTREKENLQILTDQVGIQNILNNSKKTSIDLTAQQAVRMSELKSLTESLGAVFGDLGTKLGGFASAISDSIERQKALNEATAEQNKIIDDIKSTPKEKENAEKKLATLTEKNAKSQIDNDIKLLNSGKKLFKEKTGAYKALDAIEKVQHIRKIVESNKELFLSLKNAAKEFAVKMGWMTAETTAVATNTAAQTGIVAAGNQAQAATAVPGIFAKFSAMMGPWGWAAAAAVVAALGLGGGGGKKAPKGMDAASRQEVQGTGMTIDPKTGKRIETGGGVFGDATAKSKSIQNSLDRIKETNVEGLTYSNKTVKLLESINKAIGGAAKGLYGLQGLRTGSAFGTKEGTSSGGGIGIGGIFSSSVTKKIVDSGIALAGSFLDLAAGRAGAISQYETVSRTKKSSGFLGIGGSTSTKITDQFKELDPAVAKSISGVFQGATNLLVELGNQLGMTSSSVLDILAGVPVEMLASLRDLKGAELEEELGNVVSALMDTAAGAVFSSLTKYQKFGEGMAETVIRVLDTNDKILASFKSFGINAVSVVTEGLTTQEIKLKSIEITEALADMAGGLDEFLSRQQFFAENFLTEAERLAPVQADLTKRLGELGLSSIDTREEFKNLVLTLSKDLSTESAQELYNTLQELAPAFDMVYKAAETALSTVEMQKKVEDQQVKILGLLGDEASQLKIVALRRAAEIAELKKYPDAQSEVLIANQEYIYALEDEKTARDNLIKQRDGLEKVSKALQTSLDNLTNYRKTLLGGDKSLLTPLQKYQEAQTEFERLRSIAASSTATEEERTAALSQLPGVADKFLESSRTMFASGDRYVADFNSVLSTLDTNSASLTDQKSVVDLQLDEIKESKLLLDSIDDNSKLTAEYTKKLLDDLTVQKQLVNDTRIISDALTLTWQENMLAAVSAVPPTPEITLDLDPLVAEIKLLRDEVIALRAEQETQTTNLINTNDQSVQAAAETTAQAFTDAVSEARYNAGLVPVFDGS